MKDSELALKNSFTAVKKDIDEIKTMNFVINTMLRNSFSNIKKDMDFLKEGVAEIKVERESIIELEQLNDKLSKVESSIENIRADFSNGFENNLINIRAELRSIDKARMNNNFEEKIDSLREDVGLKLKKLEKKSFKPVIKEEPIKVTVQEIEEKKEIEGKKGKNVFTKMIDFFAEED